MSGPSAVVIAGPSGVGKGTLISKLRQEFPRLFGFSVSHTTRNPRPGERDGVDYHFTTIQEMKDGIDGEKFIEWANVHGRYYGTGYEAVRKVGEVQGKICLLDIDVQGCRQVREKGLKAKFVFVAPPSMEELENRLRGRGTEDEDSLTRRLENAKGEMKAKDENGLFDILLINDNLERAYGELKGFLQSDIEEANRRVSEQSATE